MRILVWILRALAILLLLRFLFRALFGARRAPSPASGSGATGRNRERVLGELVRDPNCGTYVPKASSISMQAGGDTLYFCSVRCRDEYRDK